MIWDRNKYYGHAITKRRAAMGIRDHPIAPRSPWQNRHAERLIDSIRRVCLDHIVVFGEAHLRRILAGSLLSPSSVGFAINIAGSSSR